MIWSDLKYAFCYAFQCPTLRLQWWEENTCKTPNTKRQAPHSSPVCKGLMRLRRAIAHASTGGVLHMLTLCTHEEGFETCMYVRGE